MKLKHLLSAALIAATLFNFSSCEEDDDEINWDYENAISLKNIGTKYNSKSITAEELQGVAISDTTLTISARYTGVSGQEIKFDMEYGVVGETLQHIENVSSATLILDKPFEEYTLHLVYWGEDEDGNVSEKSDVVEVNFYYIPKIDLNLAREFGKGENTTTIKWKLGHNSNGKCVREIDRNYASDTIYYSDDKYKYNIVFHNSAYYAVYENVFRECSNEELESLKKKNINIKVEITSDEANYTAAPIELTNVDSLFVKKDVDNGIILTKKYVRGTINGKEETLYEEAYKYNFKVTVKIPVGDKFIEKSGSITSILVDGDAYAIDKEFNIYRTVKIGDDIWTIDNYRGRRGKNLKYTTPYNPEYAGLDLYFYSYYDDRDSKNLDKIDANFLNGYHVSTEEDWKNMESYLGIEYNDDKYIGRTDIYEVFGAEDVTKYADRFASNVPWHVFDSDYKVADLQSVSKYPFSFNVYYLGGSSWDDSALDDIAIFAVKGYNRIVSKKYQSIGLYDKWHLRDGNVRLVKDRE